MKIVISPAKSLDYETPVQTQQESKPKYLGQSEVLVNSLKTLSAEQIGDLMSISPKLADLNKERFDKWRRRFKPESARQALFAFKGDVYVGLDAYTLNEDQIDFLQNNLRILSGLYGMLKPLDLMQPYRLEMGTKFGVEDHKNLYSYWKETLAPALNKEMKKGEVLINLASNEYFKAVDKKQLKAEIITPNFKDRKGDQYKMISFFAKKARGLMVRYIADHNITDPELLKGFDYDGYIYNEDLSKGNDWVFTRG
ncbi:peroxide stress protein YaaA [Flammeovirga yaeyamensis]|uniref:UPF0246 protein KMW28_07105 n=1 Tax=Flammeovirga yaeyamensis TaxID=367791 RepID=A0AAX1N765_9BACT|nr:peroxide stress protein YaaA [Flammeovirga yaeyamensis]MBB3697944.1 hypothetical protein [Flammeovirga yaeyamensis]NMF35701.1 peroxide stress protein YaaA [Flammeovirga yaeyamensis]QWG03346.1 peroxide stress protein YaaA [Flammeovirga yaeyamensis]